MTDRDPFVANLLELHTPLPADDSADWDDVVFRSRRPARLLRRPSTLAVRSGLIAAALVAVLGGSALAHVVPGRFVLGLIHSDQPAPVTIRRDLRGVFHWPHGTHVLAGKARLVARLRIADAANARGVTRWTLARRYVAPTADGGYCTGDLLRESGGATGYTYACVHGPLAPRIRLGDDSLWAWRDAGGRLHFPPQQLDGTVPAATASLTLVRRQGNTRVPLSGARPAAVRYFALPLKGADAGPANAPTALVARDAAGNVVARLALRGDMLAPRLLPAPAAPAPPRGASTTIGFGAVHTPGGNLTDGRPAEVRLSVQVNPARRRALCLIADTLAQASPSGMQACAKHARGFAPAFDTNIGLHVVYGYAPARVHRARIALQDGSSLSVHVRGRAYLAVLPDALFAAGNLPARLVGLDAAGRVVARYTFVTARDFPDY